MKVIDAVSHFVLPFDPKLTKKLISFVDNFGQPLQIGSFEFKQIDENIRKVNGVSVHPVPDSDIEKLNFFDISRYVLYKSVAQELQRLSLLYISRFRHLEISRWNQVDILKYSENGKYEIHTDHDSTQVRGVTAIINLNDEYEGGNFVFFDPMKKGEVVKTIELKKGSVLFFPSNFLYPHSIQPVTKGTRYSLVAWAA